MLSKALSMARGALSPIGAPGRGLLQANRTHIWVNPSTPLEVDLDLQEERMRSALRAEPGMERDHQLNAKPSFRTTLSCDATGTGLYLHKHTRPALNPLRRKDGSV
jgi:hypothetical protein